MTLLVISTTIRVNMYLYKNVNSFVHAVVLMHYFLLPTMQLYSNRNYVCLSEYVTWAEALV